MSMIDKLIQSNQLRAASDQLAAAVREHPRDPTPRIGLFGLLALAGDLDRAEKQLSALEGLGPSTLDLARLRFLLGAERQRVQWLAGDTPPPTPDDVSGLVARSFDAWKLARAGDSAGAAALLAAIEDRRAPRSGRLADVPFDDLIDADDLLRPVLEVITPDGYAWVPWDAVQYLSVERPRDLLDRLWPTAKLGTVGGTIGVVVIPGLYPGSHQSSDEAARLGHATHWLDLGAGLARGAGARVFVVDGQGRGLWDLTEVEFDAQSPKDV